MYATMSPASLDAPVPPSVRRTARSRVLALFAAALLATTCTSCKPFDTLDQFASLKYEAPARLAVITHHATTNVLYSIAVNDGSQAARNVILQFSPKWDWNTPLCYLGLGELAFCSYLSFIENRFRSDVAGRSDFWQSLSQAHSENSCWTWSFTIPSSSNFTVRSDANDHCT